MDNLNLDFELGMTLCFDLIKAEPMTRHYPGHPAQVNINTILIEGVEVSAAVFNILMMYYSDIFHEEILANADQSERGEIETRNIFYKTPNKKGDTHV